MSRDIVRVVDMARRLPEAGRIRFGEKGPKGEPRKLLTFRFTSHDQAAIEEIAQLYGGTPQPWPDFPGQWQVTSTAAEIPIVLPPDSLYGPHYELWSGGGLIRRCDGETCSSPVKVAGGAEMIDRPCICVERGALECKPKIRLSVILPEIKFSGAWRLESGGWNATLELPGMVAMIESLQQRGLMRATLALEARQSKSAGLTRKFVVPVLRPSVSLDALAAGEGQVRVLSPAPEPALQLEGSDEWDIVDAEVVEGAPVTAGDPGGDATHRPVEPPSTSDEVALRRMHAMMREIGMGNTERHALCLLVSDGRVSSSKELTANELARMIEALVAIRKGDAEYSGEDESGKARVMRRNPA